MEKIISKKTFQEIVNSLKIKGQLNIDFLYDVFEIAYTSIDELKENKTIVFHGNANVYEIIYYLLGEYIYSTVNMKDKTLDEFLNNENIKVSMASVVADKYLTLAVFSYNEGRIANQFYPPISSLEIYNNFMLKILEGYRKNDPKTTLVTDLLTKSLSIVRCILRLLVGGYETEALASWRTLHECECTLILLDKYKDLTINAYLKHMRYGIAFKNGIENKDEQDQVFVQIKEEMKQYDLKSKDMKKYIEYGWLTVIKGATDDPVFKFNFRDGLEKIAGLEKYSEMYQLSSEILHSTPLLIYSNKNYFYYLTLLSTYESFFRLEKVFLTLFLPNVNQAAKKQFANMRQLYLTQLLNIHKRESTIFVNSFQKKKEDNSIK